ncbi:MAG: PhoH family protein [bacterium]
MRRSIMPSHTLELDNDEEAFGLFGPRDENLKIIERRAGVRIAHRNGNVTITGPDDAAKRVKRLLEELLAQVRSGDPPHPEDVTYGLLHVKEKSDGKHAENPGLVLKDAGGRPIRPRTQNQRRYVEAIENLDLVFGIGPAGTGKTYLAVGMALKHLKDQRVARIVVARPAVEAGERLGFLPGDYQEKVNPYLRPVYDALFGMLGAERCQRLIEQGTIEVAPLAYMRGRTLESAFAILDEAQNTTIDQMKMFLTRLGRTSRAVVNGDITQTDLPPGKVSGLIDAETRLKGLDGLDFVHFTHEDVVRHDLVGRIILAYQTSHADTRPTEGEQSAAAGGEVSDEKRTKE